MVQYRVQYLPRKLPQTRPGQTNLPLGTLLGGWRRQNEVESVSKSLVWGSPLSGALVDPCVFLFLADLQAQDLRQDGIEEVRFRIWSYILGSLDWNVNSLIFMASGNYKWRVGKVLWSVVGFVYWQTWLSTVKTVALDTQSIFHPIIISWLST